MSTQNEWCEGCRDNFTFYHYDEQGNHKRSEGYGWLGALLQKTDQVEVLEGLLREAGLLITHAGELHRPTTPDGGGGSTDTELLVSGEYLTRRKAWLERAVAELGPEWVEKREEVNGK